MGVRDWIFLCSSNQSLPSFSITPVPAPSHQYRCHVMQPPAVKTEAIAGVPTKMPSTLLSLHSSSAANQSTTMSTRQPHFVGFPGGGSLGAGDPTKLVHRRHTFEDRRPKEESSSDSA